MSSPAAISNSNGKQPVMALTPDQFVANTRAKSIPVQSYTPYVDGGNVTINLPSTGLALKVWLRAQFTVTVAGSVTSGTLATWPTPAPFSILKRVRIGNNSSVYIRDLTGIGLYTWVRNRELMDPNSQNSGVSYSATTDSELGNGQTWPTPGANIAAGTYNFNLSIPIDLAYNDMGDKGLLVFQSNQQLYQISIDFGAISGGISAVGGSNDFFTSLVGTGLSVAVSGSISIQYDYFDIVVGLPIGNLLSQYVSVTDQLISPQNAGQNVIQIPNTDVYSTLIFQHSNNGALLDPKNIQVPQIQHNGAVVDFLEGDALMRAVKNWYLHKCPPIDGTVIYDLGLRRGIPMRRDTMDTIAASAITNFQYLFTYPSNFSASNSGVRCIYESLKAATQTVPGN